MISKHPQLSAILDFCGKASEVILQMRYDYKNFILFESIDNSANSRFALILANNLYKVHKKLNDAFVQELSKKQSQIILIQFIFTNKHSGHQHVVEEWAFKLFTFLESSSEKELALLNLKLSVTLRSLLCYLTTMPLWS